MEWFALSFVNYKFDFYRFAEIIQPSFKKNELNFINKKIIIERTSTSS